MTAEQIPLGGDTGPLAEPMPEIIKADARDLPIPDNSVDLIVTSPPYFGLRSYTDNGRHYETQIGAEATPDEFLDALLDVTRECMRVLKPTGSLWVNLGDKYGGAAWETKHGQGARKTTQTGGLTSGKPYINNPDHRARSKAIPNTRHKSLIGIPWRYALRCIDELGLILRAEVIWCLSGGTRVYARTPTGDRPVMLRDLARAYRPENVQLWNGERWTQVLGWNRTPDDDGALEFELRTGERISCTPNHQWPTNRGLLRADEVHVGDIIETTRIPEPESPRAPALLPDDDIGWLVGLYLAEGSRSETTIQFAGHVNETSRHARLARIAEALDGTCAVYQTSQNGATCNLRGSVIVGVIDRYVSQGTAKTKRLRHTAWQRSNTFLAAVVEGYLSGDGHYDAKNDRWRLGFTANDEWAADLRTLAARLGAVLKLRRWNHTMSGRSFPGWRGEWRWTRSSHHNAKRDGEVVAIRRSRARDFYDLGVADEPHLFALASGVLTHNSKPNGLPESVTDRVRRSHEQWFHFTLQPRYYSAVDEIREPHRSTRPGVGGLLRRGDESYQAQAGIQKTGDWNGHTSPLGRLPGSVWEIATQPLKVPPELGVDHFAAFPMEWPRRIVLGWSPREVCTACGQGRRPVIEKNYLTSPEERKSRMGSVAQEGTTGLKAQDNGNVGRDMRATITGNACDCPDTTAPTTPGVVLDPFGGTGTTALVATMHGRRGISVDASADYCRIAEWRAGDPKQRAKAAEMPKYRRYDRKK